MSGLIRKGKAWVFGDGIDTDVLAPGIYMKGPIEEMAKHALEAVDPSFASTVAPGDILVGGDSFGMGSSREQAVMVLNVLQVGAVVAKSFARIFYRNAMNLALPALICPEADTIKAGDELAIDPGAGTVTNLTQDYTLACDPIPPHLLAMIEDGGLLPHLKKRLQGEAA
jgi:3-isopropylmalate/(R)-2-methylmalate dehydratase small subunit